jgi:uncharacterized protein (DUF1778 family)
VATEPKRTAISSEAEEARRTVGAYSDAIVLSKRDQEAIAQALRQPASPGPRLVAAYEKYKDLIAK